MAESRKISAVIPLDIFEKISVSGKTPTEAINEALSFFYSEDRDKIISDNHLKLDLERKVSELGSRLSDIEKHNITLQKDKEMVKDMYDLHVLQTQTLINKFLIEAPKKKRTLWQFFKFP